MAKAMPVLLAEDEEDDVFLMRRAFSVAELSNPLVTVSDGQEAIWYLAGEGNYADRTQHPEPCLMLLDLKMPKVNGFEVLEWLQRQPRLRDNLPVIVLSSSEQEVDVRRAFELGAHDYFVKAPSFERLLELVEKIKEGWLEAIAAGRKPEKREHGERQCQGTKIA
jgi:CheY-like chemotaxis protein